MYYTTFERQEHTLSEDSMPETTESTIVETMTLNEISLMVPQALEVFARYGLDSCCGGAKPLALVCERHGLNLDEVLKELRAV
jgi:iron-sulfur cluster repair protein YtfE (RIC family)